MRDERVSIQAMREKTNIYCQIEVKFMRENNQLVDI